MPPLPVVNKVIKVEYVHAYGADARVMTRQFFSYAGTAPTEGDLATLGGNMGGAWASDLAALACSDTVSLEAVTLVDLTTDTSPSADVPIAEPGGRGGATLSANDAAVVGYTLARRYRGGHPRGYWPFGVDTDITSAQLWTDDFVAAVTGGMNGFVTDVLSDFWSGAGAVHQVNVSYYTGFTVIINPTTGRARNVPTPRAVPLVNNIVESICRPRIGSQRRRLGR